MTWTPTWPSKMLVCGPMASIVIVHFHETQGRVLFFLFFSQLSQVLIVCYDSLWQSSPVCVCVLLRFVIKRGFRKCPLLALQFHLKLKRSVLAVRVVREMCVDEKSVFLVQSLSSLFQLQVVSRPHSTVCLTVQHIYHVGLSLSLPLSSIHMCLTLSLSRHFVAHSYLS